MGILTDVKHETVCHLIATGHSHQQIADAFGHTYNWVSNMLLQHPEYRVRIDEIKQELHGRLLDTAVGGLSRWSKRFNEGIEDATNTLSRAVRGEIEGIRAGDMIKASTAWLDRAPDAPKMTTRQEEERTTRMIFEMPIMEAIVKAAQTVGGNRLLETIDVECRAIEDTRPRIPSLEEVTARYADLSDEDEDAA
jgi:hypothetical protein